MTNAYFLNENTWKPGNAPEPPPEPEYIELPDEPAEAVPVEAPSAKWDVHTIHHFGAPLTVAISSEKPTQKIYAFWLEEQTNSIREPDGSYIEGVYKPVMIGVVGDAGDVFKFACGDMTEEVTIPDPAVVMPVRRNNYLVHGESLEVWESGADFTGDATLSLERVEYDPAQPSEQKTPEDKRMFIQWVNPNPKAVVIDSDIDVTGVQVQEQYIRATFHAEGVLFMDSDAEVGIVVLTDAQGDKTEVPDFGSFKNINSGTSFDPPFDREDIQKVEMWPQGAALSGDPLYVFYRLPLLDAVENPLPPELEPTPPENPARTVTDVNAWDFEMDEAGAIAVHPTGAAWELEWLEPKGFLFEAQGLTGWYGLERYGAARELNPPYVPETPERATYTDDRDDWDLVRVTVPGMTSGWDVVKPQTPVAEGWTKAAHNYLCDEFTYTKADQLAHFVWRTAARLIIRLQGTGTWHIVTNGLSPKDEGITVDGVSYVGITDLSREVILTAPDGSTITEYVPQPSPPSELEIPEGWSLTDYSSGDNNTSLVFRKDSENILSLLFSEDFITISLSIDGEAPAFDYSAQSAADYIGGRGNNGLGVAEMTAAGFVEVSYESLHFYIPAPQTASESVPLEHWHAFKAWREQPAKPLVAIASHRLTQDADIIQLDEARGPFEAGLYLREGAEFIKLLPEGGWAAREEISGFVRYGEPTAHKFVQTVGTTYHPSGGDIEGWRFAMPNTSRQIRVQNLSGKRRMFRSSVLAFKGHNLLDGAFGVKTGTLDPGEHTTLAETDFSWTIGGGDVSGDVEMAEVIVYEFPEYENDNRLGFPVAIHKFWIRAAVGHSFNKNDFDVVFYPVLS